jgi:acyl-CoA dehydrogenase
MSVALAVGTTIGFRSPLHCGAGNQRTEREISSPLGEGKLKTCMALTEPAGGTDILGAISTFAEEKQDRWVLNGEKVFITAAHASDYHDYHL